MDTVSDNNAFLNLNESMEYKSILQYSQQAPS